MCSPGKEGRVWANQQGRTWANKLLQPFCHNHMHFVSFWKNEIMRVLIDLILISLEGYCEQRAGNTSVFQYFCMWAWENTFSIAVSIPQYCSINTSVLQYQYLSIDTSVLQYCSIPCFTPKNARKAKIKVFSGIWNSPKKSSSISTFSHWILFSTKPKSTS